MAPWLACSALLRLFLVMRRKVARPQAWRNERNQQSTVRPEEEDLPVKSRRFPPSTTASTYLFYFSSSSYSLGLGCGLLGKNTPRRYKADRGWRFSVVVCKVSTKLAFLSPFEGCL